MHAGKAAAGSAVWGSYLALGAVGALCLPGGAARAGSEAARGEVYSVVELTFEGPVLGPADTPARDVDFRADFRHESEMPTFRVHGFWDGDGAGGVKGGAFRIRFTPTREGRWTLIEVRSNRRELDGQKEGDFVTAVASRNRGFWIPDARSPGGRWYARSDGSHQYVFGNTHYSFLSERTDKGPNGSSIAADVKANARYFKKLRFSIHGDRFPHPTEKPFLDPERDGGRPTDDGAFSHRPNPAWFSRRVDLAVKTAFEEDLIADLILCGPDASESRAALGAAANGGDNVPFLRYIAARYGSFPNVWICLANEFDIKRPKYTASEIVRAGRAMRGFLPYPTPVSVHGRPGDWKAELNKDPGAGPGWNDHVIIQNKIRDLSDSADAVMRSHRPGGGDRPVVNDELAYEGAGDRFSEEDVIESHLGAFAGGGYGTTGCKPVSKKAPYFWGACDVALASGRHRAAENLKWLRAVIDREITFWKMAPVRPERSIFEGDIDGFRALEWPGNEYVLATDAARELITAKLPVGRWTVRSYDAVAMRERTLATDASGSFAFRVPASRAVLFHFRRSAD